MSYIKTECADKIRESADIVKVVGRFVELKKVGANYKASSPFATDKTPSFIVSPAKQIFKCFSSGLGGDAFKFVMEHQRVNFPEALKIVGEIMAVPIEYENAEWAQKKAEETTKKDALREILTTAHKLYQKELQKLPDDHPAKLEIQRRGYGKDEVIEYGIGYAPGGPFLFDRLAKASKTREGRKLGLIGEKADKFWDRVIYPIHDRNGLLVGFAGRDVSGKKDSAKWINPIESEMYLKDKIWYGMHLARNAIDRTWKAYLVEGYNDVIAFQSNGVMNTVAGCGTAITENQMLALKKLTSHVVLALDPDNAGIKSALKHIPVFLKNGFRVQVLKLPVDPDDFVRD
ncbi:MAG: DNA primase [Oceanicaulis sp.]|nr:DNA primase [Oceanicaulis sp.]